MEAFAKSVRISPRKLRFIAKAIKGLPANIAVEKLSFLVKSGAQPLLKLLKSAIANAVHNQKLPAENLVVKNILVNEGMRLKRQDKSRNARVDRGVIHKRTSHVKILLWEKK